jgi:hypothetical protein
MNNELLDPIYQHLLNEIKNLDFSKIDRDSLQIRLQFKTNQPQMRARAVTADPHDNGTHNICCNKDGCHKCP